MKRNSHLRRIILAAVFILTLFAGMTGSYAEESIVVYEGAAEEFVFMPGSTDLFQNLKDVMPGDEDSQEIIVKNINDKPVRVYLKAEAIDNEYRDFLSKLTLSVVQDGKSNLFNAAADQQAFVDNVLLGTLYPGLYTKLDVILSVPDTMDDAYQKAQGVIRWVFTVEEVEDTPTPITGDYSITWIWYLVFVIAVIALAIVLILKKKKKDN